MRGHIWKSCYGKWIYEDLVTFHEFDTFDELWKWFWGAMD